MRTATRSLTVACSAAPLLTLGRGHAHLERTLLDSLDRIRLGLVEMSKDLNIAAQKDLRDLLARASRRENDNEVAVPLIRGRRLLVSAI